MTPSEVIEQTRAEIRRTGRASPELLDTVDEALARFPGSSALWCLRGDLIQLTDDTSRPLSEALASYRRALECDPGNVEAKREIAHFIEVHGDLA